MEALLFDGRAPIGPLDVPGMAERTVMAGSMSKAHRMIGWRVGWIAGPASIVSDAGWVHTYNTTGAVSVSRRAAEAVLRGPQEHVAAAMAELERRRDAIFDALPGWPLVRPAGGWSLLVDVAAGDPGGGVGGDARGRCCGDRRWRAGAAPWRSATCASSSAPSPSRGWRRWGSASRRQVS